MRLPSIALLGLLGALAWAKPAHAAESYENCTGFITSLPTVVSTPGTWCLNQNLTTSLATGNAITIAANNVTIDCNDFAMSDTAGLNNRVFGILATDRLNAKVRHCNISGFYYGLEFIGANGGRHVVEDNSFSDNTYISVRVEGDGSVVRRNQVLDSGGTTRVKDAYGIYTTYSVDVLDNSVVGVVAHLGAGGNAIGIETVNNPGSVNGNKVRGLVKDGAGTANAIFNANSGRVIVRNNDVVGDASAGSTGVRCADGSGRVKDNVISGFATGIALCGDAGGNDITP